MSQREKVFTYQAEVTWDGERSGTATAGARPALALGPPPDFPGGNDERWSPEHLFLASLLTCTMLSFLSQCQQRGVAVRTYRCTAHGEVGRRESDGRYAFERIMMTVMARVGDGGAATARSLTDAAERDCFISASTTAGLQTDWRITE